MDEEKQAIFRTFYKKKITQILKERSRINSIQFL